MIHERNASISSLPIRFSWWRRDGRFSIERRKAKGVHSLILVPPKGDVVAWDWQKHPDLAFDFAKVEDERSALRFANRYGELGFEYSLRLRDVFKCFHGEALHVWLAMASETRRILELWEAIERGDQATLRSQLKRDEASVVMAGEVVSRDGFRAWERHQVWKPDDVIGPARFALADKTWHTLIGALDVRPEVLSDGSTIVTLRPRSLVEAIWVHTALVVTGQRETRRCEICNGLMDVSQNRSHKHIHNRCSRNARQKKWYQLNQAKGTGHGQASE